MTSQIIQRTSHLLFGLLLTLTWGTNLTLAQEKPAPQIQEETPAPGDSDDLHQVRLFLDQLKNAVETISSMVPSYQAASPEQREFIAVRARKHGSAMLELQPKLVDLILKMKAEGLSVEPILEDFRPIFQEELQLYKELIGWLSVRIDTLRDRRGQIPNDQVTEFEDEVQKARLSMNRLLSEVFQILTQASLLELETQEAWNKLDRFLNDRAETLVGRLQITAAKNDRLEKELKDAKKVSAPDERISELKSRIHILSYRIDGIAEGLTDTAKLLDERGSDTTAYRQMIVQVTGKISENILDRKVLFALTKDAFTTGTTWLRKQGPSIVLSVLLLFALMTLFRFLFRIGWWLFRRLGWISLSRLMADLIGRIGRPISTALGLFFGLWIIGVDPTTLLAGVGVAGIIVGLALQDSLSNLAAGIFILVTRPFDVDDIVDAAGVTGMVKAMGVANTTILTADSRRLLVPNRKIWGDTIGNRSAEPLRRVDITVKVAYSEDLERVHKIILDFLANHEVCLSKPEPYIFVEKLDDSWMDLAVRPWVKNEDWWTTYSQLPGLLQECFKKEGIQMPYPRRNVSQLSEPKS